MDLRAGGVLSRALPMLTCLLAWTVNRHWPGLAFINIVFLATLGVWLARGTPWGGAPRDADVHAQPPPPS